MRYSLSAHLRLCFSFMRADLPVVCISLFSYSFDAVHLVQKKKKKAPGELTMEAGDKEKDIFPRLWTTLFLSASFKKKKEGGCQQEALLRSKAKVES